MPGFFNIFLQQINYSCNEMIQYCIFVISFRNQGKIMNKITGKLIILAAAAVSFAAASCHKDDTLRYNNVTMGNVVAGTFISDQGNAFNVVE